MNATDDPFAANSDGDGNNDENNGNEGKPRKNFVQSQRFSDFRSLSIAPPEALPPVPHPGKTQPSTLSSIASEKKRKRSIVDDDEKSPQSLPFLRDTNLDIAEMNLEEELRVPMQALKLDDQMKPVELGCITIAIGDKFRKRSRNQNSNDIVLEEDASPSVTGTKTQDTTSDIDVATTMPKVVICLGECIIDTELCPSAIQPSVNRTWQVDTFPDYFDPSMKPSVPTNSRHIFIPGNKVFARWLNEDDPGSYGAVSNIHPTPTNHDRKIHVTNISLSY